MTDAEVVVDAYLRAWNEADSVARRADLEEALSPDCVLVGPTGSFVGYEPIDGLIVAMRERMAGVEVVRTSPLEPGPEPDPARGPQGRVLAFGWKLVTAEGVQLLVGTDRVEVAADGRLGRIHVSI